jgi:two-component system sensor kinase FixL
MSSPPRDQQHVISDLRAANMELMQTLAENARLQRERFHLASIVECSSDAITSVDLAGIVTSWNRTAELLFGYSAEEMIGHPVVRLLPADRIEEEREMFARLKRGEVIPHYETRRLRKDGSIVLVSVTASPIRDEAGRILGASKILQDITEKKRAQEEVKALQAEMVHLSRWNMMGTMASSLAHEISQPLSATMNFVLASRNMLSDPQNARAASLLDKALAEINLAGGIIRSLRAFIEKRETPRAPEKLNQVLQDGLALSLTVATDTKTRIVKNLAPRLPPIVMDKVQIQQVLLNLVRNAAEAMRDQPDGRIVLETRLDEPGFVMVSVSDNGPGLSSEALKQPFQAFVTTKKQGMGVGLSICRTIIEAHGGRIWAEQNQPRGVTFRFRLPISDKHVDR